MRVVITCTDLQPARKLTLFRPQEAAGTEDLIPVVHSRGECEVNFIMTVSDDNFDRCSFLEILLAAFGTATAQEIALNSGVIFSSGHDKPDEQEQAPAGEAKNEKKSGCH